MNMIFCVQFIAIYGFVQIEWYDSEAVICNAMALAWREYKQPK